MPRTTAQRSDNRSAYRTSQSRRERCERNLRRLGRQYDATLFIDEDERTAYINQVKDPSMAVVSGRCFPQPVTDYSPLAWDWLCQRVLTAHEAAHGRYTNHGDFVDRLKQRFDRSEQQLAKDLWNAGEDTAIEAQLRSELPNYNKLIDTFRANRAAASLPDENAVVSLDEATTMAVLEKGAYDSGRLDTLLDTDEARLQFRDDAARDTFENTILPAVDAMLSDVLAEPSSPERNERLLDFARTVIDAIDSAENEQGDGQASDGGEQDEQDDNDGSSDQQEGGDGAGDGDEPAPADGLDTDDEDGPDGFPDDANDMRDDEDADAAGELDGADEDENGEVTAPTSGDDVEETDDELEQELEDTAEQDAPVESGGDDASSGSIEENTIREQHGQDVDQKTWQAAMNEADRLERVLDQIIKSDSRQRKRFQRQGRVDGTQLYRTATGGKRLKVRRNREDEPDLTFVLVLDRSGSMGNCISDAEIATIAFAEALERVGVDVAVYDLYDDTVRVGCSFGEAVSRAKGTLATGDVGGGTPLSDAVRMATDELPAGSRGDRRVLVISDDNPNSASEYKTAVNECPYPVVGVLLSEGVDMSLYTRAVTVNKDGSDLSGSLQNLAYELVHA